MVLIKVHSFAIPMGIPSV